MTLNEYIKMSYERPNRKVLEGLGASESLIEYLMETPGNTNWNVVGSITSSGGGGDAEVWLVGNEYQDTPTQRQFTLSNVGDTDHIRELFTNGDNYIVYLNGEALTYISQGGAVYYTDDTTAPTKFVKIQGNEQIVIADAAYTDLSTAPTSVEVSVKAK